MGLTNVKIKRRIFQIAALCGYAAIVLIAVLNHEYWFDEGQAWNIARDNNVAGIFGVLKYEGHPPLWFLLLHILASLGLPPLSMGISSWAVSVAAAAVIIFAFPVKPWFKAAMVLSSGMMFVNSVISRPYCLINLLVCVLAVLYPKRKKHPIWFGVVIALLANTHVCMWGLIGAIGIFMIIDLFADWKNNSFKKNAMNIVGLAIAGFGVLTLIIPLLTSLSSNSITANSSFSFGGTMAKVLSFGLNTCKGAIIPDFYGVIIDIAITLTAVPLLLAAVFFGWRKKRSFIILLSFVFGFMIVVCAVWYSTPNRDCIFIMTVAAVLTMGTQEKAKELASKKSEFKLLNTIRKKGDKISLAAIGIILAMSVPMGFYSGIRDIREDFDPAKSAAKFIEENLTEKDLIVSEDDLFANILTYLPDRQIYAINYNRFYTYRSHENPPQNSSFKEFLKTAENYDNFYIITYSKYIYNEEAVFESEKYMMPSLNHGSIYIQKVDLDFLEGFFKAE